MLSAFAVLLIVIAGGVIIGCLAWVIHLNLRARRLGLPSPTLLSYFRPPSSNPLYQSTGSRTANGSARAKSSGGGFLGIFNKKKPNPRGEFGLVGHHGEDDGAWDSRGYYEEDAEMGLRVDTTAARNYPQRTTNIDTPGTGPRSGRWGDTPEDDSPPRGRSRSRSPRPGYNVAAKRGPASGGVKTSPQSGNNPFGDEHGVRRSTDTGRSSVFHEETF
ncbi:hypothetical protein TWF694_000186 [Orbilia ellipsospora]|uniref:Uncharacterized protein n=1 Tax=Orbilia ellipsospora TaxID=2528407 RepID=A0AAV9XN76_9PEZI